MILRHSGVEFDNLLEDRTLSRNVTFENEIELWRVFRWSFFNLKLNIFISGLFTFDWNKRLKLAIFKLDF